MQTKHNHITVALPNDSILDVTYYCKDNKIDVAEKDIKTELHIQLHDCITTYKINKSLCSEGKMLEAFVHNRVVNAKGHLC